MSDDHRRQITLAHSPDPDDAFMWWPLVGLDGQGPAIDTGPFDFTLVTDDIESLNEKAESETYDITAISIAQYPKVKSAYALTGCGASVGDGYGPKLVASAPMTVSALQETNPVIAVPGERTTALLTSRLMIGPEMRWQAMPFDTIEDAVRAGEVGAGVVIHEGQLTCTDHGLHVIADLGSWWQQTRGLLLPLGGNAIRRALETKWGAGTLSSISRVLHASIAHALESRADSLQWAMQFGRGIDLNQADAFVAMYVNRWTLEIGIEGSQAVRQLLEEAHAAGLVDDPGMVEFVRPTDAVTQGVDG